MQLSQLRAVIDIAQTGSINAVAKTSFMSQSALSVSVRELEKELGITIFTRSSKGISLTSDGVEFLSYARQVVEQADILQEHFSARAKPAYQRMAISSQHYAFVVNAFINYVGTRRDKQSLFSLHETRTRDVIEDVSSFKSDIGILYYCRYNEQVLKNHFRQANVIFTPLFKAKPHAFIRAGHKLASKKVLTLQDLAPYTRYTFDQGSDSSRYYAEEPLSYLPHPREIMVSDRATMTGLLTNYDGFLISTGVRSDEMFSGIVSIPLACDEEMCVGYLVHAERKLSELTQGYIKVLTQLIVSFKDNETITPSKSALRLVREGNLL